MGYWVGHDVGLCSILILLWSRIGFAYLQEHTQIAKYLVLFCWIHLSFFLLIVQLWYSLLFIRAVEASKINEWISAMFSLYWGLACIQKSRRTKKVETGTRTSVDAASDEWLQVFCRFLFQSFLLNLVLRFLNNSWLWESAVFCAGNFIHTEGNKKYFTAEQVQEEKVVSIVLNELVPEVTQFLLE